MKVKHLIKPMGQHVAGSFLAPDATGAKHRNFFMLSRIEVGLHIMGKLAEASGFRINRALKGPYFYFVIVARIENNNIRIGN